MTERDREDDRLSTDDAVHPESETRIGAVPGEDDPVNISGYPGGATGWGAWPEGEGTHDDAPDGLEKRQLDEAGEQTGAHRGQTADSGANSGPVST